MESAPLRIPFMTFSVVFAASFGRVNRKNTTKPTPAYFRTCLTCIAVSFYHLPTAPDVYITHANREVKRISSSGLDFLWMPAPADVTLNHLRDRRSSPSFA